MFRPVPAVLATEPSTLSFALTLWNWSGRRASILAASELLPLNARCAHDISTLLFGGPTAWDARLELVMLTRFPSVLLAVLPNGLKPLKLWLARPSQKLSRLKTALIIDGTLRPVT